MFVGLMTIIFNGECSAPTLVEVLLLKGLLMKNKLI